MEYSVELRAAPMRFTATKKKYARLTTFKTRTTSNGNMIAVSTRLWPRERFIRAVNWRVIIDLRLWLLASVNIQATYAIRALGRRGRGPGIP